MTLISSENPRGLLRCLSYIKNAFTRPTSQKPVYYGAHLTERNEIGWTLRFPDFRCYQMVQSKRAGHKIYLNKNGELPARCAVFSCKAKALLKPREPEKLLEIEKFWVEIIQEEFWTVHTHPATTHTCGKPVLALNSDQINFGHYYRRKKIEMNDLGTDHAWNAARAFFETGLGIQFDAIICGPKAIHDNKISYDRKRKNAPSNRNVTEAKDLEVDLEMRFLRFV